MKRSLFSGLAQVIVKSTKKSGTIRLRGISKGLHVGEVVIRAAPATPRPYVRADY